MTATVGRRRRRRVTGMWRDELSMALVSAKVVAHCRARRGARENQEDQESFTTS
jgi:hypothetical protein